MLNLRRSAIAASLTVPVLAIALARGRAATRCPAVRVLWPYRKGMYTGMVLGAEATRNVLALCRPSPIT